MYNLTAYYSATKQVYCAIWNETVTGRAGNDIASAVRKILDVLSDENEFVNLTTWSDSYIPQNRNSFISNAIMDFFRDNPQVKAINMKYSVSGHSCVQLVDNAHCLIEKAMSKTEVYSPVGLVRLLKKVSVKKPFRVIQMKAVDFKDYASKAKQINYKNVPFLKISTIMFTQTLHGVVQNFT